MELLFKDSEIKIIVTKGSGPGGQHRNKTETDITIRHLPTGIETKNCETRSKIRNIELAKKQLNQKLIAIATIQSHNDLNSKRQDAVFSKRIRTYNFKRKEVINHLNGKKAPLQDVLNGKLELIQ